MKLIGTSKLAVLATSGVQGMSGAAAALCAELAAAIWYSPENVMDRYPAALVDGASIRIPIGEAHCVDMIANYDKGMILIEFAGPIGKAARARQLEGRRAT
jgi:hypothetical protein